MACSFDSVSDGAGESASWLEGLCNTGALIIKLGFLYRAPLQGSIRASIRVL